RRHREQAPLDFSRGRPRGGNADREGRSAVRRGRWWNRLLSGRGNRHSRLGTRHLRGHLGKLPVGRRPALRWERRRHHDHPSYWPPKGIVGGNRDGWGALFASVARWRCALADHFEAVVPDRDKALNPTFQPYTVAGFWI